MCSLVSFHQQQQLLFWTRCQNCHSILLYNQPASWLDRTCECCSSAARSAKARGEDERGRRVFLELAADLLKQASNNVHNGWIFSLFFTRLPALRLGGVFVKPVSVPVIPYLLFVICQKCVNLWGNRVRRSLRSCRKSVLERYQKSDASQGEKNIFFFLPS